MKKRFTEGQIVGFLREADGGMHVKDLCRRHGFSEASYYLWRSKFGGMSVSDAKRLKELEIENSCLKKPLADALLENEVTQEVLRKNVWSAPDLQVSHSDGDGACDNVSGLSVERVLLAMMGSRPGLSLLTGTASGRRFFRQVSDPLLTDRHQLPPLAESWWVELGGRCYPWSIRFAPREHGPRNPYELVREGNSGHVRVRPSIEGGEPRTARQPRAVGESMDGPGALEQ